MVNSQHEKSDHEKGDELPEDLNISDDLRIHLMSIKGANKKLGTRVEELSANIVGVEDRLNERLTASDGQPTDSLQVVTASLNRLTEQFSAFRREMWHPDSPAHHDDVVTATMTMMVIFLRIPMPVEAYLTDHGMMLRLTAMLGSAVTMAEMVPTRMMVWVESR